VKISIITINYNNSAGLEKTLKSVAYQTNTDFEHIIIDGASSDNSVEVIQQYTNAQKHRYPIVWVSEGDAGIYDAMNKGIKLASGEYCLFLNGGDKLSNDNVIDCVLKNGIDADIVCGNAQYEPSEYHQARFLISPKRIKASDLILHNLPHQSAFIRRQLFYDIHFYNTKYKIVSDWLFFIEAILVRNCSYKQINLFVSLCESAGLSSQPTNCELMEEEFRDSLQQILPLYYDDYVELRGYRSENIADRKLFIDKFFKSATGRFIFKVRAFLYRIGWYERKKTISRRKYLQRLTMEDNIKKEQIKRLIYNLPENLLERSNNDSDMIVSLTSYGGRVTDSAPYAIYSLFSQTVLPNRVVLYLDQDNWNNSNIPQILKRLVKSGLEIRYCEDIRSYKKLIPGLLDFPNNPIITVDDDFYYNQHFIEWMTKSYQESDKRTILGQWGCIPEKREGLYIPYSEWKDCKYGNEHSNISFFGCCCCYPPHIFDEEILKADVFMKLCPTADDIWFWAQEERLKINKQYINPFGYGINVPVNRIDEMDLSRKGNLMYQNVTLGRNDIQCKAVIEYYHL